MMDIDKVYKKFCEELPEGPHTGRRPGWPCPGSCGNGYPGSGF